MRTCIAKCSWLVASIVAVGCVGEADEGVDVDEDVSSTSSAVTITRYVPIRFIHMLGCSKGSPYCNDVTSSLGMEKAVRELNTVFADAGIAFWVQSNDFVYDMDEFDAVDDGPVLNWPVVWQQLQRIYPAIQENSYPDIRNMTRADWLGAVAAYYGDPDVLQFFVADHWGVTTGWYPENGRAMLFPASAVFDESADEPWVFMAHEMGHFFGLRHTFDDWFDHDFYDPETQALWTEADFWDLVYCDTYGPEPEFYVSKAGAQTCPAGRLGLIDRPEGATCGADPTYVSCNIPAHDGNGVLHTYHFAAGSDEIEGMATVSPFAINAMSYADEWGVDEHLPTFFTDSQVRSIKKYAEFDRPYYHMKWFRWNLLGEDPFGSLYDTYGAAARGSMRTYLGTSTADFIWWSNGLQKKNTFSAQKLDIGGTNYQPISGDFDNDGYDDILWYNPLDTVGRFWWGKSDRTFTPQDRTAFFPATSFQPHAGDFDGDGRSDILLYSPGGLDYVVWSGAGRTFTFASMLVGAPYKVLAGDFDNQHGDDIFWYSESGGYVNRWYAVGNRTFTKIDGYAVDSGGPFKPIVGNFDGVEGDDIFWYKPNAGGETLWYSTSSSSFDKRAATTAVGGTYTPIVGQFDSNTRSDILWESSGSISDYIWSGQADRSVKFDTTGLSSTYGTFRPVAGDFDGDGYTDIFWYRG